MLLRVGAEKYPLRHTYLLPPFRRAHAGDKAAGLVTGQALWLVRHRLLRVYARMMCLKSFTYYADHPEINIIRI